MEFWLRKSTVFSKSNSLLSRKVSRSEFPQLFIQFETASVIVEVADIILTTFLVREQE
jgi:hypothetical protein